MHEFGNALFTWMCLDEDVPTVTTNFAEHLLPTAMGLPPIFARLVE